MEIPNENHPLDCAGIGPKLHLLARKEARIAELAKIFFFANVVVRNEIAKPTEAATIPRSKIVVTTGKQSAIMAFKGQWIFEGKDQAIASSLVFRDVQMSTHLTFDKF